MITDFASLVRLFLSLIRMTIPILASLALLAFIWGLVKFIARVGGDEKAIQEGKSLMIWGVIALFIMVSIWGILRFFSDSLGLTSFGIPTLPQ
jgi:hypothetical protein